MAVRIRLARMGTRKRPFYRVVVAHSEAPRDGRFIEQVGYYDPRQEPPLVWLDSQRLERWLQDGAEPTETVMRLIRKVKGSSPCAT
ncbi:MAG: 30S ribosomal protein S16 [Thermodesulfobacteriota bacterium]